MTAVDDRIWRPDFAKTFDWGDILRASESRHGGLATWWRQATSGVNYYRAEMPAKRLPGKVISLDPRDLQEDESGEVVVPRQEGGPSIWLHPGNTTRALIMQQLREQGHRVIVDVDDDYTRMPPLGSAQWTIHRDRHHDNPSYEVHKVIASRIANAVICSTEYLADIYDKYNDHVYVAHNSVDPDDWPAEMPPHQRDGIIRIGWAGSTSHGYDLADIRMALDWAWRQPDVEIFLMGDATGLGELAYRDGVRYIGWTASMNDYRRALEHMDVMLCALRPGVWQNCKSDVKALEAAMAGAVPVVPKVEPYWQWWDGDGPGYVAESPKDYVKIVKHLVANREEAEQAARDARRYALEHRNINQTISDWRAALNG